MRARKSCTPSHQDSQWHTMHKRCKIKNTIFNQAGVAFFCFPRRGPFPSIHGEYHSGIPPISCTLNTKPHTNAHAAHKSIAPRFQKSIATRFQKSVAPRFQKSIATRCHKIHRSPISKIHRYPNSKIHRSYTIAIHSSTNTAIRNTETTICDKTTEGGGSQNWDPPLVGPMLYV